MVIGLKTPKFATYLPIAKGCIEGQLIWVKFVAKSRYCISYSTTLSRLSRVSGMLGKSLFRDVARQRDLLHDYGHDGSLF
jgi:hypothetical protein